MHITMRCSKCGKDLNGSIGISVNDGIADMSVTVIPCECQPYTDSIHRSMLVDFLKERTELTIAFTKRNGRYRILKGRFTGFAPTKNLLYVWDDEDDALKAVRLTSVDKVTLNGQDYEVF